MIKNVYLSTILLVFYYFKQRKFHTKPKSLTFFVKIKKKNFNDLKTHADTIIVV